MNEQMRRYLNEDLMDTLELDEASAVRERRNADRPPPDSRRQKAKERGRAFEKFYRTHQKHKKNR